MSRIHYEKGGLASDGPSAWRIDIDLDRRELRASLWPARAGNHGDLLQPIGVADAQRLRELARCAHTEADGPDPLVNDLYVKLVLDGDARREINHSGPMTAPCAKQLEAMLETLAPWPQ